MALIVTINGEDRLVSSDAMTPLAEVLRDEFFLTGTKIACGEGFCGACSVILDGRLVVSCLLPVAAAAGRSVQTIECPAEPGEIKSRLLKAMQDFDAVQCGMCFPGMIMSLTSHLAEVERPTRESLRAAIVGNICRCTGYERIIDAALSLAQDG